MYHEVTEAHKVLLSHTKEPGRRQLMASIAAVQI